MKKFLLPLVVGTALWGPSAWAAPLTVDEVVARALAHSDAVAAARGEEEAAREAVREARARRLPRLDLGYRYTRFADTPVVKSSFGDLPTSHDGLHRWQLTVSQPLFAGFALAENQRGAAAARRGREAQTARARQAVAARARTAYHRVLLAGALVRVADDAVASLEAHRETAKRFHEQGLQPRNEVLRAEVALAEAVQERERARADLALARTRLALLADLPEGFELAPLAPDRAAAADPGAFEVWLGRAYRYRPELRAAEAELDAARARERAARGEYWPTVEAVAGYERVGDTLDASRNGFANDHNAWVALEVRANLFSWGASASRVGQARGARTAAEARLRGLRKEVALEVKRAWLDVGVARANLATARAALEQARENLRMTTLQYEQQLATSADVLDARAFLTRAETNHEAAFYGLLDARTALDLAAGTPVGPPAGDRDAWESDR